MRIRHGVVSGWGAGWGAGNPDGAWACFGSEGL